MPGTGSWPGLVGRQRERALLCGLVAAAKAGRGQVLVLRGEPGIGKTALLDAVLEHAAGCRIARAAGVESEMELAFAGLQQLCRPHVDRLEQLPGPQRDALATAFGVRAGSAPDRFLVGLATLALLGAVAADRPLVCVVDDAQWLDRASAQTLAFVARRLGPEPVALVCAVRAPEGDGVLAGLPAHVLAGLDRAAAATLLEAAMPGTLDPRVRDRILAESHGNPLALRELPRGPSTAELAFGGGTETGAAALIDRIEHRFLREVSALTPQSRRLVLVAAAEPVGDVALLLAAARLLRIDAAAVSAAEAAGLIELDDHVRFRHPLLRSVVYRTATPGERREAHRALADVTDPRRDPDRRAWHRSRATLGPDEEVAADLERCAGRALSRGGLAAAAAFLEQAAALTPDADRRLRRSLDAAQSKVHAGAFDGAAAILARLEAESPGEMERARIERLGAEIPFAAHRGDASLPLLLAAARRLEPLAPRLALATYADAFSAALSAGRLATGPSVRQVAEAVRLAPRPAPPGPTDALLAALAVRFTDGYRQAAPLARRAVAAFTAHPLTLDKALGVAPLAAATAAALWDDRGWDVLTRRHLDAARRAGALSALPLALTVRTVVELVTGELDAAAALVEETRFVAEITAGGLAPYGEVGLLALRGDAERAEPAIGSCLAEATERGEGAGVAMTLWARAVLCNGLGRYRDALDAARSAASPVLEPGPPQWALGELVEAAARSAEPHTAQAALEKFGAMARASGTDWALGVEASRRALLAPDARAEDLHREAVERLARTTVRVELARAQLLSGEWLRRQGRRVDARAQLRTAHEAFAAMGMQAFAERARHELVATGETVRRRGVATAAELTPQEAHIAGLAADGLSNPEIAAALYISPRTVEWHLRKVFVKLGVSTRRDLRRSGTAYRAALT